MNLRFGKKKKKPANSQHKGEFLRKLKKHEKLNEIDKITTIGFDKGEFTFYRTKKE